MGRHILFVLGAHTCVPSDPLQAARELGARSLVFTPSAPTCAEDAHLMDAVEVIHLDRPDEAIELARKYHAEQPISAVVSYEDGASVLAARITEELGLLGHPVEAAVAAVDKPTMKQRFIAAGVRTAEHLVADDEDDAVAFAQRIGYPVVVKPCRGGASQGVMRANDETELRANYRRLRRIVRDYGLDNGGRPNRAQLVERYLPGSEISVELIVVHGRPQVTTVFEKPRPLTGPFFEETIYLTPPRLDEDVKAAAEQLAVDAAAALGLYHGPAHCEIRVSDDGLYVLEVAGRLLGGSCARVFRDCLGTDIHPLLLSLAMGDPVTIPTPDPDRPIAAALMLPVPGEGRLIALRGAERARRVPGISDVIEVGCPGDIMVRFPEQACYPVGFIGASGATHEEVEDALAWASASISVELAPVGCQRWTRPLHPDDAAVTPGGDAILALADLPAEQARELAVSHVADIMFGELPRDEAIREAECTIGWEDQRGELAGVYLPEVGLMLGFVDGTTASVCCFGVMPEKRRAGLGSALMAAQLTEFTRRGATTVVSETDPRLPLGEALLRSFGFNPDPAQGTVTTQVYSCALDFVGQTTGGKENTDVDCTATSCTC
ncbi:GNAT family N-acetyltransferase [Catenulispora rubra]|uniref:GNAT family N-acetyltransferase n=1 Tax=Catenulispora rubra TaxID=280293 RepID=UPI00189281F7|nr:GNAT family N-acetyltransferase [Catenulispora rubra]